MFNFINNLNHVDLKYCHWKSNEHLSAGLTGETDLDVLASKGQQDLIKETLKEAGFRQVSSPAFSIYPYIQDWIGFDEPTGELLHLHLHYRLLTGKKLVKEQFLPWTDRALKTRRRDEDTGVYVIDPNLELINLAIRIAIKTRPTKMLAGKPLPVNIVRELDYLKERTDTGGISRLATELFGQEDERELAVLISKLLAGSHVATIFKLKRFVRKKLAGSRRYGFLKTQFLYFFNAVRVRVMKLANKLGATFQLNKTLPDGKLIAIVGADGSGKSSSVKALKKWLGWKLDTHTFYLGQDKTLFSYFLRAIHTDLRSVYFAWKKYKKLKKIDKLRLRGSVVITDRYPQTQVRGINDGPLIDPDVKDSLFCGWLFTLEQKYYEKIERYKPDVVVRLNVSQEKAQARKPDHETDEIQRKIAIVEKLEFTNSKVIEVDASQDLDGMVLEIKQKLWKNLN